MLDVITAVLITVNVGSTIEIDVSHENKFLH